MFAREVALIQRETDKMERENKVQNVLYRWNFTVYVRLYITTSSFWWGIGGDHSQPEHQPEKTVDSEGDFGAWSTGNLAQGLPPAGQDRPSLGVAMRRFHLCRSNHEGNLPNKLPNYV